MKKKLLYGSLLVLIALVALAATTPVKKISEYPTTTTNDNTDLILIARTNDVATPTNYNIKASNVRKYATNGMPNDAAMASAILSATNTLDTAAIARVLEQTNRVTTNITAAVTEQTNNVTTNLAALITASTNALDTAAIARVTEQTNRVTTNLSAQVVAATNGLSGLVLGKTVNWVPQTNGIGATLSASFVFDSTVSVQDFWWTNSLAATNSSVTVSYNGLDTDVTSFAEQTNIVSAVVPAAGLVRVHWLGLPAANIKFSVQIVP